MYSIIVLYMAMLLYNVHRPVQHGGASAKYVPHWSV
jgi:hypothetical protein